MKSSTVQKTQQIEMKAKHVFAFRAHFSLDNTVINDVTLGYRTLISVCRM